MFVCGFNKLCFIIVKEFYYILEYVDKYTGKKEK